MFEKSLYDLIRGLRNHKGNERAYIQDSIRECRREIKTQDMDLKATALLKLTYLEMFGHDMSWASFNVLEVMSSPKYQQKRVGYLAGVQSFRPDTEVLMLAENLLNKDLRSPQAATASLPLIAIPHVISTSMANSLLSEVLPRLSHSNPNIRKKTVVTLYRLALASPDTLRPAWPRIRDRLTDENEDPSVTAAVVNVVCELGWRRPQDFLPLAPRLFDLLVEGNNNWMAIKIIKLFAALTPLEPRLVRKLLPPLTTLIKTTPAMSLLYECINGIIHGGIFESASGTTEGDDIARLCVGKLGGMLSVEGDPNLKYVALLAFNKIVESHPYLVSMHEDTILECIDDPDVSIRLRALDLVNGMVNASNLVSIVDRLMRQLRESPLASSIHDPLNDRAIHSGVEPAADSDDDDPGQSIRPGEQRSGHVAPLPDDYRASVIQRILEICSRNTYANISDFDWYVDVLLRLVKHVPATSSVAKLSIESKDDLATSIGAELRNVAIRVKSSRQEATQAAEMLVYVDKRYQLFPRSGNGGQGVLGPAVWIVGEYAQHVADANAALNSLLQSETAILPAEILSAYIQAAVKLFVHITHDGQQSWTAERKTVVTLLLARIIYFLEPLTSHPSLEIQERSVEFIELFRLATEAVNGHEASMDEDFVEPPLLLIQALPSLFAGLDLNPVAPDAQRKVPRPEDLDLDTPINDQLSRLLEVSDVTQDEEDQDGLYKYYHQRPKSFVAAAEPAANLLPTLSIEASYQQSNGNNADPLAPARLRAQRRDRHKDDPFYIPSEETSGTSTPGDNILKTNNGEELDVDSIPIMELDLGGTESSGQSASRMTSFQNRKKTPRREFEILGDESIGDDAAAVSGGANADKFPSTRGKKSLLQLDSSKLGSLALEGDARGSNSQLDIERREAEEAEMAAAMKEVERLRLEMQRAQERIEAKSEATVVKRKVKKKSRIANIEEDEAPARATTEGHTPESEKPKKKKKKKKSTDAGKEAPLAPEDDRQADGNQEQAVAVKKKKKRRQVTFEEET